MSKGDKFMAVYGSSPFTDADVPQLIGIKTNINGYGTTDEYKPDAK